VAEVAQKVALKLRAIWLVFGCKMLLWPFGTLPNFGNEQQNNIYRYRPNEVQKLDIFGKKSLFTTTLGYTVNYAATSLVLQNMEKYIIVYMYILIYKIYSPETSLV